MRGSQFAAVTCFFVLGACSSTTGNPSSSSQAGSSSFAASGSSGAAGKSGSAGSGSGPGTSGSDAGGSTSTAGAAGAGGSDAALGGQSGEGGAAGEPPACIPEASGGAEGECTLVELGMKAPEGSELCVPCGLDWLTTIDCRGEMQAPPVVGCPVGAISREEVSTKTCMKPHPFRVRMCAHLMPDDGPTASCEPTGPERCKEVELDGTETKLIVTLDP
jgi:hypothetical protein